MAASLLLQPRPFLPLRGQTSPLSRTARPVSVSLGSTPRPNFTIRASASAPPKLSDSTRTITSLVALSVSASVSIARILQSVVIPSVGAAVANNLLPSAQDLEAIRSIGCNLAHATGPMFAAIGKAPAINTSLNTPLTLVAAGLAKWLEIYGGVVMVRVLLSWFPNIPWERQPLSALRDLCDPYLSLFRNIIPPLFNVLDISPLLAFAVLGVFQKILRSSYRV